MALRTASCPLTREQVIQLYFLEHRARLLDVAAYLDRLDRARTGSGEPDFRETAMQAACRILADGHPDRVARILSLLSDDSVELPESACGMKGASGAVRISGGGA